MDWKLFGQRSDVRGGKLRVVALVGALGVPGVFSGDAFGEVDPSPVAVPALGVGQSLLLLGFSAEALAVAGVSDEELQEVREFVAAQAQEFAEIRRLREAVAKKAVRDGPESSGVGSSAGAGAGDEQSELTSRVASLRTALLQVVGAQARGYLSCWLKSSEYRVDSEFRVLDMSNQEWRRLEAALGAVRAAARAGMAAPEAEIAVVQAFEGRAEVAAAAARLNSRKDAIRQALRS